MLSLRLNLYSANYLNRFPILACASSQLGSRAYVLVCHGWLATEAGRLICVGSEIDYASYKINET